MPPAPVILRRLRQEDIDRLGAPLANAVRAHLRHYGSRGGFIPIQMEGGPSFRRIPGNETRNFIILGHEVEGRFVPTTAILADRSLGHPVNEHFAFNSTSPPTSLALNAGNQLTAESINSLNTLLQRGFDADRNARPVGGSRPETEERLRRTFSYLGSRRGNDWVVSMPTAASAERMMRALEQIRNSRGIAQDQLRITVAPNSRDITINGENLHTPLNNSFSIGQAFIGELQDALRPDSGQENEWLRGFFSSQNERPNAYTPPQPAPGMSQITPAQSDLLRQIAQTAMDPGISNGQFTRVPRLDAPARTRNVDGNSVA